MYIVTFTAHQQRNMVRTPTFLGLATPLPTPLTSGANGRGTSGFLRDVDGTTLASIVTVLMIPWPCLLTPSPCCFAQTNVGLKFLRLFKLDSKYLFSDGQFTASCLLLSRPTAVLQPLDSVLKVSTYCYVNILSYQSTLLCS